MAALIRFEYWDDGSLSAAEMVPGLREHGLIAADATLVYALYATSYEGAARMHHALQGWEPYTSWDEERA